MPSTRPIPTPTREGCRPSQALATLIAGYQFRLAVPPGVSKRYLGLRYTVGTAETTAGKVTAGLVIDKQTNFTV